MRRVLLVPLFLFELAGHAAAQRLTSSVDLSGTSVWYADSIRSGGPSVSPSLRIDWPRATLNASASVSRLGGDGVTAQGTVVPSLFTPPLGPFVAELTGSAGGSTHTDGSRTGQALAISRLHAMRPLAGAWIGAGGGSTWDGFVWRNVRQAEAGVWFDRAGMTTLATASPVIVADTLRYTDVQAAWRYPIGSYELGATAGVRSGAVGSAVGGSSRAWASASVVAWVTQDMAIVASGGSYPVDFTQGFPGGHFVSVALRIASRPARPSDQSAPRRESPDGARDEIGSAVLFQVRPTASAHELRVYAPGARSVEIDADFTNWQPLTLHPSGDGWWSTSRAIAPGTYQIDLRVDGGPWTAPPGLMTTKDEFGGVVGILSVE